MKSSHYRRNATALCAALLVAVLGGRSKESSEPTPVGADRDEHGCIPSAGYQWCERTQQCERPWELAKKEGLDESPEAFSQWCDN